MRPKQIPGTGLFVRGTGFSAEQIAGYRRDLQRLNDYIEYLNNNPEALAASLKIRKNGKGPAPNAPTPRSKR